MKTVFVHLSGSHRGDTQAFEKEKILLGCDPACDVRFDAGIDDTTSDRHAEVYLDNCEYYLRDLGSARGTFVNEHEIDEVILKDGDLLEIGEGGPKLRFHIEVEKGEVCKPFRVVYRDSVRKARRFREPGVASTVGFIGEFSRGLLLHSTPVIRIAFVASAGLIAFSVLLSALVLFQGSASRKELEREIILLRKQVSSDRMSREALEREVADERVKSRALRSKYQAETAARLEGLQTEEQKLREQLEKAQNDVNTKSSVIDDLKSRLSATTEQISAFQREVSMAQQIIKRYQGGVCFIQGIYHFEDGAGSPLRYVGLDSSGDPQKDSQGRTLYTTSGTGPIADTNYSGTGFLVSKSGLILTNRHVVEPWWEDDEAKQLSKKGFHATMGGLRAFFPNDPDPFPLTVVKISTQGDVALAKTDLGKHVFPVLQLDPARTSLSAGQRVVLLGYPTGLDALLARLDEGAAIDVMAAVGSDPQKLSLELARRKMIRPLSTQGHLSDILPYKLVYDAQTTYGGSGGPLFNLRGKVIGINFAILSDFGGANFGVPIQMGWELMKPGASASGGLAGR
ncbi:MAG: trypsin-like peptidase domain-containing protein [Acidobacteriia bacterium]|nr:trypsin-like peptidase domain-containing protein [Terriglobia bacterium]